jgi:beta-galactosidase
MTNRLLYSLMICCSLISCYREKQMFLRDQPFDESWLFHKGDISNGEVVALNDSGWRKLDIPHDWSIEDLPGTISPFDSTVVNGVSSGFTRGGIGWYRKHFTVGKETENQQVFIRFDGVYMNSDVWVNGHHAGNHFYGYTPFEYDIGEWLNFGNDNVIAVRVNNDSVRCRWYSGSGIFRHVWLTTTSSLHIDDWGIAVTTTEISEKQATVVVNTTLYNQFDHDKNATIRLKVKDAGGKQVANSEKEGEIKTGQRATISQQCKVPVPHLWSTDDPYLYKVVAEVLIDNKLVDCQEQVFGIRSIQFDAQNGFRLNGKATKLKGGCIHHDNGPLGSAALDRAEERKVELLRAAGFNAIRMAHNPPSTAMLDACDRLGMLVIDEAFDVWRYGHFSGDYSSRFNSLWRSDLESMILRDHNHPSIIMWSIGNEIRNSDTKEIADICGKLADFIRSVDSTRPVTAAVNSVNDLKDPYFSHLDVCGYNYCQGLYVPDHERLPGRIMFCSESYASEAYDYWQGVKEYPWVIGDFVWTAFDHIGEASIGWRGYPQNPDFFPWNLAYCGDFDICGNRRPQSYFRQTLWDEKPVLNLFATPPVPSFPRNPAKEYWSVWDWPDAIDSWNFNGYENRPIKISAYSNCDEVELFLNGISLGRKANGKEAKNILEWMVPYQPGELKALGFDNGKTVDTAWLRTANAPAAITLNADRGILKANGQDLCYVSIEIADKRGLRNPSATNKLTFSISGAGSLAAVGSPDPTSLESFQQPGRKAWQGRCMVILRSGKEKGKIRLVAQSEGLPDAEISVKVK